MNDSTQDAPYRDLGPDLILDAVDRAGWQTTGMLLALNSYENRVYQIGVEDGPPIVAKFYRPGRWTTDAILEEHAFLAELAEHEIPVIPALTGPADQTLLHAGPYRFALFPCQGGRAPDLESNENLSWLGRYLGRIHAAGASGRFQHRPAISIERLGTAPRTWLLKNGFLPDELAPRYEEISSQLLEGVQRCFEIAGPLNTIRLHGDFHPGNVLWSEDGPHIVDLDDCATGPACQDIWMLLSGDRQTMGSQLGYVLDGYTRFADFNPRELHLVEALRALRLLHYTFWIACRWHDPAFPRAFPWFSEKRYWEKHIQSLREQIPLLDELPLPI